MKIPKPLVLIIRDGWGYSTSREGNAVMQADTPHYDRYLKTYPYARLKAAGTAVGLPEGMMGNSEINHINMGAGRVVDQDVTRINKAIADGSFFKNRKLNIAFERCLKGRHALHIMGIFQTAGVHSVLGHLEALLKQANDLKLPEVYIHIFADGRDSPPRTILAFIKQIEPQLGAAKYATIVGRHMLDRSGNYEPTREIYKLLTEARGKKVKNITAAVEDAYANSKNPGGGPVSDEFLPAYILGDFKGIKDHDTVVFFNFRQDRAVQLTKTFVENPLNGPEVYFVGMTKYYDSFDDYLTPPLETLPTMKRPLGEILSHANLRQMRIADQQKFRHVTSFFNLKRIAPFPGEDRIEVATGDPARYIEEPAMGMYEVAKDACDVVKNGIYDFIVVNFANCDMVGHTTDMEAAKKAVTIVDETTDQVVQAALETGGAAIVTADHGNVEQIHEAESGEPFPPHTSNDVEFFYISKNPGSLKFKKTGIMPSVAPTILDLLGLPIPSEMTAESLLVK